MRAEPGRQLIDVARDLESRHVRGRRGGRSRESAAGSRHATKNGSHGRSSASSRPAMRHSMRSPDGRVRDPSPTLRPRRAAVASMSSGRTAQPIRSPSLASRTRRPKSLPRARARRRLRSARGRSRRAGRSSWPCPTRDGGLRAAGSRPYADGSRGVSDPRAEAARMTWSSCIVRASPRFVASG